MRRDHAHDVGRFDEWASTYDRHWMQRWLFAPVQQVVLDLASAEVPAPGRFSTSAAAPGA